MELRFTIDDAVMNGLQERTHTPRATDVARDGIELLSWATQEISAGRRIVAIDDSGNTHVPVMGVLNRARQ